jgi:hypothetical protein
MRTPDDVAVAAATRYRRTWRDTLLTGTQEAVSFALKPPTAAAIITNPEHVAAWLTAWRQYMPQHPSAELRTRTIRTKHGNQPVHTHLDLPDTEALANLNVDTRAHWQHVTNRWITLRPVATSTPVLRPWLAQIMELPDVDFALLLSASDWFQRKPHSGLTIRRVPVLGMHTKWLARHRRLVLALLGTTPAPSENDDDLADRDSAAPDVADLPASDLDALGLRPVPREADIVLADRHYRDQVGGLRQLRAPLNELAALPITPRWVLVIENKEAALSLPDTTELVIIHSLGNHTDALRHLPWIPADSTLYWGDLDRHGYTMLSRARTALPHLRSVLMSATDVDRFRHLAVTESATRYDPPDATLTADETHALNLLAIADGHLRIEQERIPVDHAQEALADALAAEA